MLIGADLLAKIKELGDVSKTKLATACGYVSKKKDGSDRVNFTAFYEALLSTKDMNLGAVIGVGKAERKLFYIATVQFNGALMIGKAYTTMLDLESGDTFEIKLSQKQIRLVPTGTAAEHAEGSGAESGEDETQVVA